MVGIDDGLDHGELLVAERVGMSVVLEHTLDLPELQHHLCVDLLVESEAGLAVLGCEVEVRVDGDGRHNDRDDQDGDDVEDHDCLSGRWSLSLRAMYLLRPYNYHKPKPRVDVVVGCGRVLLVVGLLLLGLRDLVQHHQRVDHANDGHYEEVGGDVVGKHDEVVVEEEEDVEDGVHDGPYIVGGLLI